MACSSVRSYRDYISGAAILPMVRSCLAASLGCSPSYSTRPSLRALTPTPRITRHLPRAQPQACPQPEISREGSLLVRMSRLQPLHLCTAPGQNQGKKPTVPPPRRPRPSIPHLRMSPFNPRREETKEKKALAPPPFQPPPGRFSRAQQDSQLLSWGPTENPALVKIHLQHSENSYLQYCFQL